MQGIFPAKYPVKLIVWLPAGLPFAADTCLSAKPITLPENLSLIYMETTYLTLLCILKFPKLNLMKQKIAKFILRVLGWKVIFNVPADTKI